LTEAQDLFLGLFLTTNLHELVRSNGRKGGNGKGKAESRKAMNNVERLYRVIWNFLSLVSCILFTDLLVY
jgi:hypothetical protein